MDHLKSAFAVMPARPLQHDPVCGHATLPLLRVRPHVSRCILDSRAAVMPRNSISGGVRISCPTVRSAMKCLYKFRADLPRNAVLARRLALSYPHESVIVASVVVERLHRDGIFERDADHLGRSMMPASIRSIFLACGVKAVIAFSFEHAGDHHPAVDRGVLGNLTCWCFERALDNLRTSFLIALAFGFLLRHGVDTAQQRQAPAGRTIPSATAALVALIASSKASFFDFISDLAGAPTRITATPPASFASLSCSFSLS